MKTTLIFKYGIIFSLIISLGCSKDSDTPCGKITNISISYSQISTKIFYHLTVKLSDGSNRYDIVETSSFNVGDEYCNATDTTP